MIGKGLRLDGSLASWELVKYQQSLVNGRARSLQVSSRGVGDSKDLHLHVAGGKNPWCLGFPGCVFDKIIIRKSSTGKDSDSDCIAKSFCMQDAEV